MGYAFKHGETAYTPDGKLPASVDADAHNAAIEAAELAEWAKGPDHFTAYIVPWGKTDSKQSEAQTWRGVKLGSLTSFRTYRANFGQRMAAITVRGNNGRTYWGRYSVDNQELCRLHARKGG
jgi:hypothetical protein